MILNQPVFTLIPPTRHSILSWFWTNLSLPWFHRHDTPHYHDSEPTSLYLDSTDTTLHIIMILNQPVFTLISPTRHSIVSWFWTNLSLPWFHRHDTPYYYDSEPTCLYLDFTDTTLHIIMILNQPVFTLISPTRHSILLLFWTNLSLPWFHRHDTPCRWNEGKDRLVQNHDNMECRVGEIKVKTGWFRIIIMWSVVSVKSR
jgi:hypothetical protein